MATATEQFQTLVAAKGSDTRVRRVDSTIPCPCRTPEGFRDPIWHEQTPPDAPEVFLAGYEAVVEASEPVAFWHLDTAPPITGSLASYQLTPFGAISYQTPGVVTSVGNSLTLPGGSGNYLECLTSDFVFSARRPYSFGIWIRPTSVADSIIASCLWATGTKISGWSLEIVGGGLEFVRQAKGARKSVRMPSISVNTSYYVLGRYDGSELRLYVNNVLIATTSNVTQSLDSPSNYETVAFRVGNTTNSFAGRVDEIAIYNKALGEDRINLHWLAGSAQPGVLNGQYQYFFTWVDEKGERPKPSPGSVVVIPNNQRVWIVIPDVPADFKVHLYRRSGIGPYYYVGEIGLQDHPFSGLFMDNFTDAELTQQNPPNYICNEAGYLPDPANTIDMQVKAFVQPALSTRRHIPREQFEIMFAGAIQEDDHLGIFPCTWSGTTLNFDDWSRSGEDFIEYRGRRFVVVGASMIPDPSNGAPDHHWELALRLTDKKQLGVA